MKIHIEPEVFEIAPAFHRGLVIATGIDNSGDCGELEALLKEAQAGASEVGPVAELPSVAAWDEAHRAFSSNPNKFPPAHKNLFKRVSRPDVHLPFISKVVAIMNTASLRLCTPVGGDDINRAQSFGKCLELRRARGNESFVPLGKNASEEHPEPGEIIYVVGETVMCRRWNWRNSCQTLIGNDTTRIVMNIDCLGADAGTTAQEGAKLVGDLLEQHCGATVALELLHKGNPEFDFDSET
ncbi:MAG: phenylalanine--tRNA ligase beta subunit-related protein [Verrucomicrobiota bacterium]